MSAESPLPDGVGGREQPRSAPAAQSLSEKVARLHTLNSPGLEKIASTFAGVQAATAKSSGIATVQHRLRDISKATEAAAAVRVPKVDFPAFEAVQAKFPEVEPPDFTDALDDLGQIDWANMPQSRAARAAEQTAQHLEVLVDAALSADQRAADAERRAVEAEVREAHMLRLSITNTRISIVAAVAGVLSVIVTLLVTFM